MIPGHRAIGGKSYHVSFLCCSAVFVYYRHCHLIIILSDRRHSVFAKASTGVNSVQCTAQRIL